LRFEFAAFVVDASKMLLFPELTPANVIDMEKAIDTRGDLAIGPLPTSSGTILSVFSGSYANGIGTHKNRQDSRLPLFNLAA
jgi:hypothetical protein